MARPLNIFRDNVGAYGTLGWAIYPVSRGAKIPMAGTRGCLDASANCAQHAVWAKQYPHSNIAMLTGEVSKVIVVDLDPRSGSDESIKRLAAQGKRFPDTVMSATPSGGNHLYFAFHDAVTVSRSNAFGFHPTQRDTDGRRVPLYPGIDVATNGHGIVLPPSWSQERQAGYRWIIPPRGNCLVALPRWAIDMLKPKPDPKRAAPKPMELSNLGGYRRQAVSDLYEAASRIAALQDGRHEAPFKVGASLGAYVHHKLLAQADLEEVVLAASAANGSKYSRDDRLQQIRNGLRKAASDSLPPLARMHRGDRP